MTGNAVFDFQFAVMHGALDDETIARTTEMAKSLEMIDGPMIGSGNHRRSRVGWITPNESWEWLFDLVSVRLEDLNARYYGMDVYGFSEIQYTEYDAEYSGAYDWHNDVLYGTSNPRPGLHRKLSITIALNDDFEGGEFQITTSGEANETIRPELRRGSFLLFPSHLTHRVTTVTRGTRRSLVAWVVGPKIR